jgi:hypothetical protein
MGSSNWSSGRNCCRYWLPFLGQVVDLTLENPGFTGSTLPVLSGWGLLKKVAPFTFRTAPSCLPLMGRRWRHYKVLGREMPYERKCRTLSLSDLVKVPAWPRKTQYFIGQWTCYELDQKVHDDDYQAAIWRRWTWISTVHWEIQRFSSCERLWEGMKVT